MIVWVARKLNYPIQMIQVDGPPTGLCKSETDEYQRAAYRGFHVQDPGGLQKSEQACPGILRCGILHGQPFLVDSYKFF